MTLSEQEGQQIVEMLGPDLDLAFKLMKQLAERPTPTDKLAARLGVDPLEAERVLSKMRLLGLVTDGS